VNGAVRDLKFLFIFPLVLKEKRDFAAVCERGTRHP